MPGKPLWDRGRGWYRTSDPGHVKVMLQFHVFSACQVKANDRGFFSPVFPGPRPHKPIELTGA